MNHFRQNQQSVGNSDNLKGYMKTYNKLPNDVKFPFIDEFKYDDKTSSEELLRMYNQLVSLIEVFGLIASNKKINADEIKQTLSKYFDSNQTKRILEEVIMTFEDSYSDLGEISTFREKLRQKQNNAGEIASVNEITLQSTQTLPVVKPAKEIKIQPLPIAEPKLSIDQVNTMMADSTLGVEQDESLFDEDWDYDEPKTPKEKFIFNFKDNYGNEYDLNYYDEKVEELVEKIDEDDLDEREAISLLYQHIICNGIKKVA